MKNVLLIGLGRLGAQLAQQLSLYGHQVMAVDESEEKVNNVLSYVTNALIGDSTNEDFLRSLGVNNYDLCFVAIGNDFQDSLQTTSLLKDLGAVRIISMAEHAVQAKFLLRNGADEVIFPEQQTARWAVQKYASDHVLDLFSIDDTTALFEIRVPKSWAGRTIGDIDVRKKYHLNIAAVKKEGHAELLISPDMVLTEDMSLVVLGEYAQIQRLG